MWGVGSDESQLKRKGRELGADTGFGAKLTEFDQVGGLLVRMRLEETF